MSDTVQKPIKKSKPRKAPGIVGKSALAWRISETQRIAYQLYAQRGFESGYELDDWLKAESMVKELQV